MIRSIVFTDELIPEGTSGAGTITVNGTLITGINTQFSTIPRHEIRGRRWWIYNEDTKEFGLITNVRNDTLLEVSEMMTSSSNSNYKLIKPIYKRVVLDNKGASAAYVKMGSNQSAEIKGNPIELKSRGRGFFVEPMLVVSTFSIVNITTE